jgi:hypothetical protein
MHHQHRTTLLAPGDEQQRRDHGAAGIGHAHPAEDAEQVDQLEEGLAALEVAARRRPSAR